MPDDPDDLVARLDRLTQQYQRLFDLTRELAKAVAAMAEAGHEMAETVDELTRQELARHNWVRD
jgi:Xaa-Pro aminopeptidase